MGELVMDARARCCALLSVLEEQALLSTGCWLKLLHLVAVFVMHKPIMDVLSLPNSGHTAHRVIIKFCLPNCELGVSFNI